jgi:N-acetylglucosaminyldiphosphoundecaprenol N-acetyl-beta-D-mannosaminyltransferase
MVSARVLGVRVDCVGMAQAVDLIEVMLAEPGLSMVATVNPELVMRARSDAAYRAVLESAALSLVDGWGVQWAVRRQGCPAEERVPGIDLVLALAERACRSGFSIFLLGARPGVAEEAGRRLTQLQPGLRLAGTHAGSPGPEDDERSRELIARARPDLLLVAYGAPEQELWIARNRDRLPARVAIGVGGALDFVSGRVPRAPGWMRRLNLEWFFRLIRQPWRIRRMAVLPRYALEVIRSGS